MANTIKALSKREDALLESPTGSGKTMALLCASLAWQQTEAANLQVCENRGCCMAGDAAWPGGGTGARGIGWREPNRMHTSPWETADGCGDPGPVTPARGCPTGQGQAHGRGRRIG